MSEQKEKLFAKSTFKAGRDKISKNLGPSNKERRSRGLTETQLENRKRLHQDWLYTIFKVISILLLILFFLYLAAEFYFVVCKRKDLFAIQKIISNISSFFLGVFIKTGIEKYLLLCFPQLEATNK